MAIYNRAQKGLYPYSWEVEPYYNGATLSSSNYFYLEPRYTDGSSGNSMTFSTSTDYAPGSYGNGGNYIDLDWLHCGNQIWYSRIHQAGGSGNELKHVSGYSNSSFGFRYTMTILMLLGVGTGPHPGLDYATTNFAILRNSNGSNGSGNFMNYANGSTPVYTSPRTLIPGCDRIRVSGDSYGMPRLYRDWTVICQQQNATLPNNISKIRIINHGLHAASRSRLHCLGFKMIFQAIPFPTDSNAFGGLNI